MKPTPHKQRHKQAGKALVTLLGDRGTIQFLDGGAKPLKVRIQKFQHKPNDGHGSHHQGKNKLG